MSGEGEGMEDGGEATWERRSPRWPRCCGRMWALVWDHTGTRTNRDVNVYARPHKAQAVIVPPSWERPKKKSLGFYASAGLIPGSCAGG